MHHFSKIVIIAVTVVILTLSLALAGGKFKNEDTAKNRKNNTFGTDPGDDTGTTVFKKNDDGNTVIKSTPPPKAEEVDWYDKVIITVNPDTQWPRDQSTTSTSTVTGYNNATDVQTTTTTTQKINTQ